jgi:hypothetical protein
MTNKHPVFKICVIIAVLCFCAAIIVFPQTETKERPIFNNTSVMTAEGSFDRVELIDRHFGDYNGQEVEGDVLAVLYENGSIEISEEHYEARPNYNDGINYPFFLYVYDEVDHLREKISVEGGTSEDFIYLNVIVTISLGKVVGIRTYEISVGIGHAITLCMGGVVFGFLAELTKEWR